ncbi:MAG: beta-lactamase family protein [Oscillospiraceae bacterium]|nr:beta-lactamase family protein [Oscillospiraceae bacterium]
MFEKLVSLLDSFPEQFVPGYDCVVYHKGKQVFRRFGGVSSLETGKPVDGTEQYFIYSCSKPITAAVGMLCLERGLFQLDESICKYLPEFTDMTVIDGDIIRPAKRPLTVKDLFCMTGGFSYDAHSPQLDLCRRELPRCASTRDVMKYLAREPLLFDPGDRWEYSFCHDVLVALIEVVTGEDFDNFARKNVFEPLGMDSTTYLLPSDVSRIAEQYVYHPDTKSFENCGKTILDFASFGPGYESGGAGCISSVNDCIRFLEALRTGESILKRDTVKQMTTNQLTPEQSKTYWMPGYGYGLGVKCSVGNPGCGDYGWGGMAGALMSVDPANELSMFFVQHVLFADNNVQRYQIYPLILEELGLNANHSEGEGKPNFYV